MATILQISGAITWDQVCTHKAAGGLGFRNILLWNVTSLAKYVWAIETKQDSVCIKWVDVVYLIGDDWWNYVLNASSSWY